MTVACSARMAAIGRLLVAALLALVQMGCATVRLDVPRPFSEALKHAEPTALGRAFAAQMAAHPEQSGFHVLDTGPEAFLARAALADAAERTLDLQYYTVGNDLTTDLLLRRIVRAAQRGVRVRILLDDIHAPNRNFALRALAAHPNIEVRMFNPFLTGGTFGIGRLLEFIGDGDRLNRRMHNKLWVADNAAGIIGGRNLGDEYFDANPDVNFSDLDLLAAGPVVSELSRRFDEYWNSEWAVPAAAFLDAAPGPEAAQRVQSELDARLADSEDTEYGRWLTAGDFLRMLKSADLPLIWASAHAAYDKPDKPETVITRGMQDVLPWIRAVPFAAKFELIMISPYFIPSEEGRQHLGEMRSRGVRVAVLTNSLASTDAPAAHAGYARHRTDLLRRGIELFELRPAPDSPHPLKHRWRRSSASGLHAKIVVVDRARAFVGSMNLDPRSRLHNTEAWIALESPELASRLVALFDESAQPDHSFRVLLRDPQQEDDGLVWITEEQGREVRYESEPLAGFWMRFWRGVLSIFVPEHMM